MEERWNERHGGAVFSAVASQPRVRPCAPPESAGTRVRRISHCQSAVGATSLQVVGILSMWPRNKVWTSPGCNPSFPEGPKEKGHAAP